MPSSDILTVCMTCGSISMYQHSIAQTPCVSHIADTSASLSMNACISDSTSSSEIQQSGMQLMYTTIPIPSARKILTPALISILAVAAILCCCCMIAGLLAALFFGKRQKKKLKVQITDSSGKKHE